MKYYSNGYKLTVNSTLEMKIISADIIERIMLRDQWFDQAQHISAILLKFIILMKSINLISLKLMRSPNLGSYKLFT